MKSPQPLQAPTEPHRHFEYLLEEHQRLLIKNVAAMPPMVSTIALLALTPDVVVIAYYLWYMIWKAAIHAPPVYKRTETRRNKENLPVLESILASAWYFIRASPEPIN